MAGRGVDLSLFVNWRRRIKGACRVCAEPIPKGRRTLCGPICEKAVHVMLFPNQRRKIVYERDRSRCATCGLVVDDLIAYMMLCGDAPSFGVTRDPTRPDWRGMFRDASNALGEGWNVSRNAGQLWDVDHIKGVEHGGINVLDNLQTLCVPCHRAKSKAEAGSRAKARRHRAKEGPKARRLRELREAQYANVTSTK